MDCSCRTAALRIFIKTIAQVHIPLRTPAQRLAKSHPQPLHSQPSRFYNQRAVSLLATTSRPLHTSCSRKSAADAVRAVEAAAEDGWVIETSPRSSEPGHGRALVTEPQDVHPGTATPTAHKNKPSKDESQIPDKKATKKARKEKQQYKHEPGHEDNDRPRAGKEPWMIQKETLKKKFPGGWNPRKKLSPDALIGIRMLHKQFPEEYTTDVLAQKFEVSPEAIRRVLKSKWVPSPEEETERQERWFNRGKRVWTQWAALGKKPPRRWRAEGIVRDPYWNRPRGPNHKDKAARAEAQRRLAKNLMG